MSVLARGLGRGWGIWGWGDEVALRPSDTCLYPNSYLHAKNIIHRDLKSNSIYMFLSKGWAGVGGIKQDEGLEGWLLWEAFWGQTGRGTRGISLCQVPELWLGRGL